MATKEPIVSHSKIRAPSDRSFGLVFVAVFTFIGVWPIVGGRPPRLWALVVGGGLLLITFVFPAALGPLNRLWQRFGFAFQRVTTPLLMGIVYYGTVVPMAMLLRTLKKDLLRLKWDPAASSYWIPRQPPGPERDSMSRQF